jgi:antitoxin component of MazEF toxin-antitoxin module
MVLKMGFDSGQDVKQCLTMIKTITKIGNSHGIIFDSTLLQLAHLKPGDEVNVEVHAGGMITIAPLTPTKISVENATATAKRLIGKNDELFRRLS